MKKCICILLLIALTLSGCHGARSSGEFVLPAEFDASREYEITFWAKNDTNLTQVEIYKSAIREFEALYPNIKVNLRLYTDYGRLYSDVITNIATQTTPNVCVTYPDHIATYLTGQSTVVPLDALFADPKYGLGGSELRFDGPSREEMIPKFLEECKIGETYYAVPYMRSTECCYVNKDYVEKLGYELPEVLTWDFVWEVSQAAMAKDEAGNFLVNGQKTMIPFIYKSTDNMMISMLRQLNAPYSTPEGEVLLFNEHTKEILRKVGQYGQSGAFSTFKISSYPANFLNAGQCIFAIDSTAGATWMGSEAPLLDIAEDKLVSFETVVLPIPQYDTENWQMISQGPSLCLFNKQDPQEVLASWLFAQYMLTNSVQLAYSQTEGYVPVTQKAQDSPEYQDYLSRSGEDNDFYYSIKLDAAKLLIDHVDKTFVTPVFNGSASLRDAAGQLIENTTKAARRNQALDEAYFEKLFSDMNAQYHLGEHGITGKQDLGPLPGTAIFLLCALAVCWLAILAAWLRVWQKNRKKK